MWLAFVLISFSIFFQTFFVRMTFQNVRKNILSVLLVKTLQDVRCTFIRNFDYFF